MSIRSLVGVVCLATTVALPGALGAIASAHADTVDDKFLADLQAEGIDDHVSAEHAVKGAHVVCQKLDSGMTAAQVAFDVLDSSSMPGYHSGFFVGAAIDAYCPQYRPEEAELRN